MSELVEVRMVQQMSGGNWPPVGGTMMVSEAEAEILCHSDAQHPTPIAVRTEKPKAETADAPPPAVEVAQGAADEAMTRAVPPAPEPEDEEPSEENLPQQMRRGPGRPPGSKNRPK